MPRITSEKLSKSLQAVKHASKHTPHYFTRVVKQGALSAPCVRVLRAHMAHWSCQRAAASCQTGAAGSVSPPGTRARSLHRVGGLPRSPSPRRKSTKWWSRCESRDSFVLSGALSGESTGHNTAYGQNAEPPRPRNDTRRGTRPQYFGFTEIASCARSSRYGSHFAQACAGDIVAQKLRTQSNSGRSQVK